MLTVANRTSGHNLQKPTEIVRGQAARLPWAWDKLVFALPLNEPSRLGMRDIANNLAPATVVGGTWGTDNRGNPTILLYDSEYLEYPDNPVHDSPSSELTVYARLRRTTDAPNIDSAIICNVHTNGASPWISWTLGAATADATKLLGGILTSSVSSPTTVEDTLSLSTTQQVSLFLRWRTGSTIRLDVLGERGDTLSTTSSGSTLGGSITYAAGKAVRVNVSDNGSDNYLAYYSQVLVWGRRLSDVELASLVADPFGWYSPRRETITLAAPFPVGPGLAAPGLVYTGAAGRR